MRRTEDPLAELARLIGQDDPFADFVAHRPADGRAGGHSGAQRRPIARDGRQHDPRTRDSRRSATPSRSSDAIEEDIHEISLDSRPSHADARSAYSYGSGRPQRAGDAPAVSARGTRDDRAPAPRPVARAPQPAAQPLHDEDDFHAEPQPRSPRDTRAARREAAYDEDGQGEYATENYDPEYDDDAYLPAHGDEFYDEAPRRRLKGWMLIGIAAVAAIVVGTSGLFAYRALFGTDQAAGPAKLISPDSGPTKMVPKSSQTADNKRVQDRVGEAPRSGERIVSREESPIDQSRIPQGGTADRIPSGNVTAAASQFSPPPQSQMAPAQAASAQAVAPANLSTEPRRVRTVTVRSDGSVVSNQGASAPAAAGARPTTATTPLALQNGGQAPLLPPQRPTTTSSTAPLRGDNPWSSGPSSGQVGAPATQQAALPPQQASAPTVAVQSSAAAGSYVVQVAAQKSEGEAQATWQALQQKYGSVLGSQQAAIRRVDLGERGVFYRAQVGPFTTRAQASEVCQSLKAAGGECVIQRN